MSARWTGALMALLLAGCASLTVTHIDKTHDSAVNGVRYCLPKPFLQATPQADGTISVDVIYLPDQNKCYAIDTSSKMSSYTFQFSRDEKGLLTAVEYKASTTGVGQQFAASASAAAVQTADLKSSQAVALQTAVNAAQTAVDAAQATAVAAKATLDSDTAYAKTAPAGTVPDATLAADTAAVAAANAKLQASQQVLDRARATSQAVALTAAAATPITTTGPTMGTAFTPPTWNAPVNFPLPDAVGPVLYAINDQMVKNDGGELEEKVELVAVKSSYPHREDIVGYVYEEGAKKDSQPTFATTTSALGPPQLLPSSQTMPAAAKQATFLFDRPVLAMTANLFKDGSPPTDTGVVPALSDDKKSVTIDTSKLKPGRYIVKVVISYSADSAGHTGTSTQTAKLELT
ncbi:MAG: hypothetical protein JWO52_4573 [Gammaproteobacteria bacterium]|nr:hypothetical protein [Gammaproteobacteria bacterium]